jgi:hypothetical protein
MLLWVDDDGDEITIRKGGDRVTITLEQGKKFDGDSIGAAVLLPKPGTDDAASFIKSLAQQLDIEVEIRAPRQPTDTCVTICQPDELNDGWQIHGDIADGLTMRECLTAMSWMTDGDYDSINYMVERMLRANWKAESLGTYGSESSCFFAYPKGRQEALKVAALVNSKVWLEAGGFPI